MEFNPLLTLQASVAFLLASVLLLNLIKSNPRNRILAYFLSIVLYGLIFDIFNPNHQPLIHFEILGLFFSIIYYGPVLYLYLLSLFNRVIDGKIILKHISIPFLILFAKFSLEFILNISLRGIGALAYLFLTSALLVFYLFKGYQLVRYKKHTDKYFTKFKFRLFFYSTNGYFLLLFIVIILYGIYGLTTGFGGSLDLARTVHYILFIPFCLIMVFYGFSEAVWLKRFFVSSPTKKIADKSLEQNWLNIILNTLKTNQDFINPNISIEDFSKNIGLTSHQVSQALKFGGYKNFANLLNHFRVQEFKNKMSLPKYENYTLNGIALECGFNSKSTFYRAFKNEEGITPKAYKDSFANSL